MISGDVPTGIALLLSLLPLSLLLALWRAHLDLQAKHRQLTLLGNPFSSSADKHILNSLEEGVFGLLPDGKISFMNPAGLAMLGLEESEVLGQDSHALFHHHHANHSLYIQEDCPIHQSLNDGQIRRHATDWFWGKQGGFPVRLTVIPEITDGNTMGMVVAFTDIAEQSRNLEELSSHRDLLESLVQARTTELIDSNAKSQHLAQVKGAFLANMSHEIRTPINAILGFTYLGLRVDSLPRALSYLNKIHVATESLLVIVNDILDFSKIEAGKLTLESIPFSIEEVIDRIAGLFGVKAREKQIELVLGAFPNVPAKILGDPTRLAQILINLVGNAVKFTSQGEVVLTVEPLDITESHVRLRFVVSDTGVGMDQDQIHSLFTPFTQADSSTTRKFGGTGLGLAISTQLLERMGGDLRVESELGVGSRFSFTIEYALAHEANEHCVLSSPERKRVLVVDDNAIMCALLKKSVESLGCIVETTDSSEKAMELLTREHFDHLLLDWHLPDMDGLELAHRLRGMGISLPITLITGDEIDKAQMLASPGDIQAYLSKPVSRSSLENLLTTNDHHEEALVKPLQSGIPNLKGRRILLVDDNDFNREVGTELLELTGAVVVTAMNGRQAVEAASTVQFDLVFMDIQMPVMDGYAATHILRDLYPDLPVLALTAHALEEELIQVQQAGMNDMLTKPILPETLYTALKKWLGESEPAQSTQSEQELMPQENRRQLDRPLLDVSIGLITANGVPDFYQRMLQMFQASESVDVAQLRALIQSGRFEEAARQAHTLKGMAGSIGAMRLRQEAADLEHAIQGGESHAMAAGVFRLENLLRATLAAIAQQQGHET